MRQHHPHRLQHVAQRHAPRAVAVGVESGAQRLRQRSRTATLAAATASSAACQPANSCRLGTIAPASPAPSGTPVCLTENTSDMRCAGVVRDSRCELAGVIGP